jgi:hypothetical protein
MDRQKEVSFWAGLLYMSEVFEESREQDGLMSS